MGFFDKFKSVIDTATDAINKSIETSQKSGDPLADLTVKKYFEIICGMRHTFLLTGPEAVTDNERAKNYIEHFLGEPCDIDKLERALELYNISREDCPSNKEAKIVSDFRKSLKDSKDYTMNSYEACRVCCQKEIEAATVEYNRVLDVIKDNVNFNHFSQGLKKINLGFAVEGVVIYDSFSEGNLITQELLLDYFIRNFTGKITDSNYKQLYDFRDDISLVVLKALHFEKYGQSKEGYTTVTEDEYRNFVLNTTYYSGTINNHPFDKDEYIEKFIKCIKESKALSNPPYAAVFGEDYYCDFACNYMWKTISAGGAWIQDDVDISNSTNEQDVFAILCHYFENL